MKSEGSCVGMFCLTGGHNALAAFQCNVSNVKTEMFLVASVHYV